MKKKIVGKSILIACLGFLCCSVASAQVTLNPSSGRIMDIDTDFVFRLTEKGYNRPILQSGWLSGVGDFLAIKHGGSNTEATTYGFRISDAKGFEFGKNDFGSTFFKVNTNGNVGIGTSNPGIEFDVRGRVQFHSLGNTNNFLHFDYDSNGNKLRSYGTNLFLETRNITENIEFRTNNSANSLMIVKGNGNVGIGTTSPDAKLAVNGNIHAKEVKIDLVGWPDYVFENTYQLPKLDQVETHIKEKGHLQNIPSAQEVAENGIELGEMNKKLLEKIEELTLYTIAQEKELNDQEKRIKNLENKLEKLLQQ